MRTNLIVLLFVAFLSNLSAQNNYESGFDLGFAFNLDLPLADFKDRFGNSLGGDFSLNFTQGSKGLQYSLKLGFMASDAVREDPLADLRTSEGYILSSEGSITPVNTRLSGTYVGISIAKLFNLKEEQNRCNIFGFETGIMQHKIAFSEFTQTIPSIKDDYSQIFNRNTIGPYIAQEIGYRLFFKSMKVDLLIHSMQGFTKEKNSFTVLPDTRENGNRIDIILGVKARMFIGINSLGTGGDIYY